MKQITEEALLTTEEAAKILRCSKWTVVRMIKRGDLEGCKPNRIWLIRESALRDAVRRATKPAVKQKEKQLAGSSVYKIV